MKKKIIVINPTILFEKRIKDLEIVTEKPTTKELIFHIGHKLFDEIQIEEEGAEETLKQSDHIMVSEFSFLEMSNCQPFGDLFSDIIQRMLQAGVTIEEIGMYEEKICFFFENELREKIDQASEIIKGRLETILNSYFREIFDEQKKKKSEANA